jgi:adenine modification enzyme
MPQIKDYLFSNQGSLLGSRDVIGFGEQNFYVIEIDRKIANKLIKENHYSKKVYAGSYVHLAVMSNNNINGVLQFGYAMNPASQSSVVAETKQNEYLELNRMWLHDDLPKNSESKAISYSVKYIKRKFNGNIKWIQSFADERCGRNGIVYQACSFRYYGEHSSDFWELDGEVYHNIQMTLSPKDHRYNDVVKNLQENKHRAKRMNLRQFRYLFFIDQRYREKCLLKEREYPKHYLEVNDNATL